MDKDGENSEVYNHFIRLSKPTEEDFKREFSEDELKELCLRHKCKVDMWRWNVVNDYRILFTESGRYQRWSERVRLRMLSKAVNRMKPAVLYDEEEIRKTREEEWGLQLKENILSLNFWKHKRLRDSRLVALESDGIDRELQLEMAESNSELPTHSQIQESPLESISTAGELDLELESLVEVNTDSMKAAELLVNSEALPLQSEVGVSTEQNAEEIITERYDKEALSETSPTRSKEVVSTNQNEEENFLLDGLHSGFLADSDSEDSIETVKEVLTSEEVAPEIQNLYCVSTMSMSIDSEMSSQSILQSEDVIAPNYDVFLNVIPLTSTQSQTQELVHHKN